MEKQKNMLQQLSSNKLTQMLNVFNTTTTAEQAPAPKLEKKQSNISSPRFLTATPIHKDTKKHVEAKENVQVSRKPEQKAAPKEDLRLKKENITPREQPPVPQKQHPHPSEELHAKRKSIVPP